MPPPTVEQITNSKSTERASGLLTLDLGSTVLNALLDCGVGFITSSWQDRPTPIDAAIDDARERVLALRGVALRRLRSLTALESALESPVANLASDSPRGAVVFGGRHGMRPTLERFCRIEAKTAIVGFCFDVDVLQIEDAIIIDPVPSAIGITEAIEQAFEASARAKVPAVVVLQERLLAVRGTVHRKVSLAAVGQVAKLDEDLQLAGAAPIGEAVEASGLLEASISRSHENSDAITIWSSGPARVTLERSLEEVASRLEPISRQAAEAIRSITIVSSRAIGVLPLPESEVGSRVWDAEKLLIIGHRAARLRERLLKESRQESGARPEIVAEQIDLAGLRGEQLASIVARWCAKLELAVFSEDARECLVSIADELAKAKDNKQVDKIDPDRIARRSDVFHRSIPQAVAAGLTLAQGVIGVPGRIDSRWPTYRTSSGVALTVAPAALFIEHGVGAAAPKSGIGVIIVTGSGPAVMSAAGTAGATVELVDGSSPRAIGLAVSRACQNMHTNWHVIVVSEVVRVSASDSRAVFGMDPELVGLDRVASDAVPAATTRLVDVNDELDKGPRVVVLNTAQTRAHAGELRELSPASWDLTSQESQGRAAKWVWGVRRRLIRSLSGVQV